MKCFLSGLSPKAELDFSLWKAMKKFYQTPILPLLPLLVDSGWIRDNTEKFESYIDHLYQTFQQHNESTFFFSLLAIAAMLDSQCQESS